MIRAKTASSVRCHSSFWLFGLANTLLDASHSAFVYINDATMSYIVEHLELSRDEASRSRTHDWHRYGTNLLGLIKQHGVQAGQFLEQTYQRHGPESRLRMSPADGLALRLLRGRKFILTNAPRRGWRTAGKSNWRKPMRSARSEHAALPSIRFM